MTSPISDTPTAFTNANGSIYLPQNYLGSWKGEVEVWYALAASLNIPALRILDMVGFDAAIARSTDLLGIPQSEWEERAILPVYALGLGVCSIRPIELARAFAIFANNGEEVIPICIRNIEDKNGNIIHDVEQETINKKRGKVGIDDNGVLLLFAGVAMHDCWSPYWKYEGIVHAICNAHLLREITGFRKV